MLPVVKELREGRSGAGRNNDKLADGTRNGGRSDSLSLDWLVTHEICEGAPIQGDLGLLD